MIFLHVCITEGLEEPCKRKDFGDGVYYFEYYPTTPGNYIITITWGGQHIPRRLDRIFNIFFIANNLYFKIKCSKSCFFLFSVNIFCCFSYFSPFEVKLSSEAGPQQVRAWGPGLEGGIVGKSADFVVEAVGDDVGTLGEFL